MVLSAVLAFGAVNAPAPLAAETRRSVTVQDVVDAFSDEELVDGFVRTVFGAETERGGRLADDATTTVKKFRGRVRVHVMNLASEDRSGEVKRFVEVLRRTVQGLRIGLVDSSDDANMVVFLVDRSDYRRTIRDTLPASFDTRFLEFNACSAVTGGRRGEGLQRAFIYIAANEGRSSFRHCMVEEITQSLGPVNDDPSLVHSIYNDNSRVGGFGVFDWFILNMLYDRRVRIGMSEAEVRRVLPAVIRDARRRLPGVLARRDLSAQ